MFARSTRKLLNDPQNKSGWVLPWQRRRKFELLVPLSACRRVRRRDAPLLTPSLTRSGSTVSAGRSHSPVDAAHGVAVIAKLGPERCS